MISSFGCLMGSSSFTKIRIQIGRVIMLRSLFILLSVLSVSLFFAGSVSLAAEKAPAMGKAELLAAQATLVVTAIDHKTREVTLKNEEGEEKTFVIGKEA
ncbi:hypothetical protein, partial [Thiolapillus sp.]